jgi:preprotein translocase subunit YajC
MTMEPAPGDRVLTADGGELGKVKRVEEVAFLVDVSGQPDFWLNRSDIADAAAGTVHMSFELDALSERRIKYGE